MKAPKRQHHLQHITVLPFHTASMDTKIDTSTNSIDRSIPLPYLTQILAPHVRDWSNTSYTLMLLSHFALISMEAPSEDKAQEHLVSTTLTFTQHVLVSSVYSDLKRALLALPLNDLYNTVVQQYRSSSDSTYGTWNFMACDYDSMAHRLRSIRL
jgi:hypothetical protein